MPCPWTGVRRLHWTGTHSTVWNWGPEKREKMLLLFETAAGFALFKVLQENKIQETEVSQCLKIVKGGWR